jgi:hypothetical protein
MKKINITLLAVAMAVFMAGCGSKISQSNYDRLKEGMTQAEVTAILGEPTETEVVGKSNNIDIKGPVWEGNGYKIVTVFSDDGKLQTKRIDKY